MKKTSKRITSALLSALMLCGAVSATSLSASAATSESAPVAAITETDSVGLTNYKYEVINKTQAKITKYTGTEKNVIIPSKIDNYTVTAIGYGAFQYNKLESVEFLNSVTTIEQSAFEYCSSLKTVKFGTGLTTIGVRAFFGTSVASVTIPSKVTKIDEGAFDDCTKLKTVTLNDNLTEIGNGAFKSTAITTIKIPNKVKTIGDSAFYGCKSLKSVTLGSSVSSIGQGCFADCKSLESISIPGTVKTISSEMFEGCSALKSVVFNRGTQEINGYCFNALCKSLKTVTIPETVTKIAGLDKTSKTLKLYDFFGLPFTQVTIRGYENSFAHQFAKANGIKFDPIKFATPSIVSVNANNNGAGISWKAVPGIQKYRVYKKVNGKGSWQKVGDTTGASYTDKSVKANNTYTYTVRGITSDGSAFVSGYNTNGVSIKYTATPSITKREVTAQGIKLTWNKPAGTQKVRLYVKKNGSWSKIGDTTNTSYTYKDVKSGTSYAFTVRTVTTDGKQFTSGYSTSGWSQKYVATPQISSLTNTKSGVQIKYNKPAGTDKFRIYRKTGSGSWTKLGDTTATTYTDKTAKSGTTYSYTVRCISSDAKSFTSYYNTTGKSIKCKK